MRAVVNFIFPPETVEDDNARAAKMITQSFMHTTSYVSVFRGDESSRKEPMEFLFRRNLYMIRQRCPESIHCLSTADGEVQCFYMLVPSFTAHFSLYEKVFIGGILEFGIRYGFDTLSRLIRLSDFCDAMEEELMRDRKYYSLQRMIVAPQLQGKGIGSKCLGEGLKEADRAQLPVVLGTQDARNLIYYGRLGFKTVREMEYKVADGDDPQYNFKTWFMIREPLPLPATEPDSNSVDVKQG